MTAPDLDPHLDEDADDVVEAPEPDPTERGSALLRNRRRVLGLGLAVVLMLVAIYAIFPKVVGLEGAFDRLDEAKWYWIVVALCMPAVIYGSYAVLFRSVMGKRGPEEVRRRLDFKASIQITMSGLAASALFSAAGAGGIALQYWAMRKAGMSARRAACRQVAFLVILYSVYLFSLIVFGVLLRSGAVHGEAPVSTTIVPAAIAGCAVVLLLLIALIPGDMERRIKGLERHGRLRKWVRRLAALPSTLASGVRTAIAHIRNRRFGPESYAAAIGFWAGNIGILWASFHAFGVHVPLAVVVQGFFVGMVANLVPSPAAGVGTVDAGLIGSFVVFGLPAETVFPAVLVFRLIGFWLQIPIGVIAYLRLLRTAHEWEDERASAATIKSEVTAKAR